MRDTGRSPDRRSTPAYVPRRSNVQLAFAPSKTSTRRPSPRVVRWVLWLLAGAWFASALGYLALRYLIWPHLDDWRPRIVAELSARFGHPVEIARIETGFEGLLPRLVIEGLTVADDDGEYALAVPRATVVLSARTLLSAEPRFAVLQLESPRLRVERRVVGWLRVAGVDLDMNAPDDGQGLDRLLNQRRILLRDARLDFRDRIEDRRVLLTGIDLTIGSVGRRHRASLTAGPLEGAWQRLHLAVEFYRPARSAPADWNLWAGEVYAGIDQAEVALLRSLPLEPTLAPSLEALRADLKGWLRFDRGKSLDTQLKLAVSDLAWRVSPGPRGLVNLAELGFEARLRQDGEGHDLRVSGLRLRERAGLTLTGQGEQRIALDAAWRPRTIQASLSGFDSAAALALVQRLPWSPASARELRELQLSGRIGEVQARWVRQNGEVPPATAAVSGKPPAPAAQTATAPTAAQTPAAQTTASDSPAAWLSEGELEASATFEELSLRHLTRSSPPATDAEGRPVIGLPWFEHLSGQARLSGRVGELKIDAKQAVLGFPGIFAQAAVPMDELSAEVRFRLETAEERTRVVAEIGSLKFSNADAAGVVEGSYRSGGKGPGVVDLKGKLDRGDGTRVWRYLPLAISQPVRDWVQRAVVSGKVDDVRFSVRGDLWDFPFRQAEGEFVVDARLSEATLAYASDWPRIERAEGRLRLERNGLQVAMRSGQIYDVALAATTATIRDYGESVLRVEGSGEGPAQQMIRFVNESPVATRIDDFVRDTVAQGSARLQLNLELPLRDFDKTRVAGSVGFLGNTLKLDDTIPGFSNLTGTLEFSEQGLALRGLSATFLGGPLKVEGETPERGRFALRAQGRIAAEDMRAVVDNPLTRRLSGATDYRASIDVARRAVSMAIESDLVGLGAALPPPFDKSAADSWPLKVHTVARPPADPQARSAGDQIRVELRDSVRLLLEREREAGSQRLLIRRGAFAVEGEPVLPERGLSLLLNGMPVDLDAWMPLLTSGAMRDAQSRASADFAPGFSLMPTTVSVVAPRVIVGRKQLNDVVFGASRAEGFWRANISAREVNGFFNWREPAAGQRIGTLTARFTRLEIPRARTSEIESLLDSSPDELPALDVAAEELVLGERRLGALSLKATNGGSAALPVWRLDELRIVNPAAALRASGRWAPARAGSPRATHLDFELEVGDAGDLLGVYGLRNALRGGSGTVAGSLRWQGSPMAIDYPSLTGNMRLKIGKGQFLKSEPGLAKLIGVLSLQSLPRRLSLDFRDVFAEGFAFDEIDGDVTIQSGVAHTERFQMRGVQAQVDIRGQASLEHETQNLEVRVRPEFNAGLASLAYAAMVHPAIGLGTFLAQFVLRRPLQEMLSYEYLVTGPWADPQVAERARGAPAAEPITR